MHFAENHVSYPGNPDKPIWGGFLVEWFFDWCVLALPLKSSQGVCDVHPSRAQHTRLPLPVFPVAGPPAPGALVAPAQHAMSISSTVWTSPW